MDQPSQGLAWMGRILGIVATLTAAAILWWCLWKRCKSKDSSSSSQRLLPSFSKTVKVYSHVTGQTCGAHNVILDHVRNVGLRIDRTTIETTTDPMEADMVIVFCPITSRVGSDVDYTMSRLAEPMVERPVLLVLLHHTRDIYFSTNKENWSQVFPNVLSSFDVLFHETHNGLLDCQRNEDAMAQIQKTLLKQQK